jgi:hypothetical protein
MYTGTYLDEACYDLEAAGRFSNFVILCAGQDKTLGAIEPRLYYRIWSCQYRQEPNSPYWSLGVTGGA